MGLLLLAPHKKPFGFATSLHPLGIWLDSGGFPRSEQRLNKTLWSNGNQNPYDISLYWSVQLPGFLQWLILRIPKYKWAVLRPPITREIIYKTLGTFHEILETLDRDSYIGY